jgi:hypothetical protein
VRVIYFKSAKICPSILFILRLKTQEFLFGQIRFLKIHSFIFSDPWNILIKSVKNIFSGEVANTKPPPWPFYEESAIFFLKRVEVYLALVLNVTLRFFYFCGWQ